MNDDPSCARCIHGSRIGLRAGEAHCCWLLAQDEAGDRMPRWAWIALRGRTDAIGPVARAAECPAFDGAREGSI